MSDPPLSAPRDIDSEPITSRTGESPPLAAATPQLARPSPATPQEPAAPIAAMPIIELGEVRTARSDSVVEVDATGVHRSSMTPRMPRPAEPASLRPATDARHAAPVARSATAHDAGSPPDTDVDDEGYLRSDALHTLLDPSELNGTRDTARFALSLQRPSEPEADGPEIPVDVGSDVDAADASQSSAQPSPDANVSEGSAPAPREAESEIAPATSAHPSAIAVAADAADDEPDSLEAHDTIDVDIDTGSDPQTPVAATAPAMALNEPDSHAFDTPENRSSEIPTEVDPEDMEIEEVAEAPLRVAGVVAAAPQARSRGADLAAAVQAQNANETPAFKRARYWWDELFGDDFLRTMDKLTDAQVRHEVNFIEESLAVQKSGIVLDLACGAGRHAVEMASRGYNVVGYDLSVAMLARAADEAQERKQKLNFLHGDMRDMGFEEMFDGIFCWSTSFGYFDDDKNLLVAQNIHRALRKGGMFLLDLANRDFVAQRQPSLVWFEGEGCVCMDEMRVDFITSRLKVKRMVMLDDGRSRELDYSIRLYTLHELGRMLHEVGFKVTEVSGQPATPGVFMGADSPRIIVLAEKA